MSPGPPGQLSTQQREPGKGAVIINQAQRHPPRSRDGSPDRAISKRNFYFFLSQMGKVRVLFQLTKGLRCPKADSHALK